MCVGSLAGYIGEAMNGPPFCLAFVMVKESFVVPAIFFYLESAPPTDGLFCAGTVVPQCCAGIAFFCAAAHWADTYQFTWSFGSH